MSKGLLHAWWDHGCCLPLAWQDDGLWVGIVGIEFSRARSRGIGFASCSSLQVVVVQDKLASLAVASCSSIAGEAAQDSLCTLGRMVSS